MKTKMNNKVKALLMACCAVLLVFASVLGTLAYLTDSKTVTNTFTVGNVEIKLTEANVDADGEATSDRNETGMTDVKLIPGRTIDKDPTITVVKGSEKCYIRAIVTLSVTTSSEAAQTNMKTLMENAKTTGDSNFTWTLKSESTSKVVYEVRYNSAVECDSAKDQDFMIFESITVPATWDNAELESLKGLTIALEAHAIQFEGFENNVDSAWTEFEDQTDATTPTETTTTP